MQMKKIEQQLELRRRQWKVLPSHSVHVHLKASGLEGELHFHVKTIHKNGKRGEGADKLESESPPQKQQARVAAAAASES